MTEKKRYYRTNVNLEDNNHEPYYNIRDRKKEGNNVLFMVGGKYTSKEIVDRLNEQEETIQSLKKELFESEKDYIMETYSDNPIRRDEKIQSLKEEFKARFGDVE